MDRKVEMRDLYCFFFSWRALYDVFVYIMVLMLSAIHAKCPTQKQFYMWFMPKCLRSKRRQCKKDESWYAFYFYWTYFDIQYISVWRCLWFFFFLFFFSYSRCSRSAIDIFFIILLWNEKNIHMNLFENIYKICLMLNSILVWTVP